MPRNASKSRCCVNRFSRPARSRDQDIMTDKVVLLRRGKSAKSRPGAEITALSNGRGQAAKSGAETVEDAASNGVDQGDAARSDAPTATPAAAVAVPVAVQGGSPLYSLKVEQFAIDSGEIVMVKMNKDG